MGKKWFGRVTPESDSGVRGVPGSQEGAEKGCNPFGKGQKSYHPIFCLIAGTRECLHNWFRPGSTYSANGIVGFAKECLSFLPKGMWKVFVRADSAFLSGPFSDFLESRGASYLIKVRMRGLGTLLPGSDRKKIRNVPGFGSAEFGYQCAGWSEPRRFVAVRELVRIRTEGPLFPEYEYRYFCYVTNESLTPWEAHRNYGKRPTSENRIGWCGNQMAAGTILTQDFRASPAPFQTCVLAYNLVVRMMLMADRQKLRQEPNTVRFWIICVPARLLMGSRRRVPRLSQNSFSKGRWLGIENAANQLCLE